MLNIKMCRKSLFKIAALALSIILSVVYCLSVLPKIYVCANELSAEREQELLNSYLSNNDVSDEYIEGVETEIEAAYENYIYLTDEGRIAIDTSELTFEEDFEIAAIDLIQNNMCVMNAMVDAEVAYIDDCFELIYTGDDDFVQQWSAWGFNIRWNRLTVNMDRDFAMLFSAVGLVANFVVTTRNIEVFLNTCLVETDMLTYFNEAYSAIPSGLAELMLSYFTDETLMEALSLISLVASTVLAGGLVKSVISIVFSLILPAMTDCMTVFYNACRYSKGVRVKFCWFPSFGNRFGLSLTTI